MEEKKTLYQYIGQVFLIFGFSMTVQSTFCLMFGEEAKEFSTMFSMGNQGVSVACMWQFLFLSVLIVLWRFLFFTDVVFREMPVIGRTVGMVAAVLVTMLIFILLFEWFPVDMWEPWVMFLISFGVCFTVSVAVTGKLEKAENRKMEEALRRAKQKEQAEGGGQKDYAE